MTEYNDDHPIIKKARMLSGDNPRKMTEEEMRSCAEYCRRFLNPTTEEKAEIERKAKESLARFEARKAERKRRTIAAMYPVSKPQKIKFFGIGWWWYK